MKNELLYTIALTQLDGVGYYNAKKIVDYFGSASDFFESPYESLSIDRITKKVFDKANLMSAIELAKGELDFIEKNKISTYVLSDELYPSRLKQCPDAPVILYGKGKVNLNSKKVISIVGTRKITAYGKTIVKELVEKLPEDVVVVSGLAYGVDIEAHKLALETNKSTVAVLAHGLDRIYPSVHSGYAKEMLNNGGLLTDFISGTIPNRENFPKRNRIVAGISEATIVVESSKKGGSLITANVAHSYDRDVFAYPGKSTDINSVGCNFLIKSQKAQLVESAEDILRYLNWDSVSTTKTTQIKMPVGLNINEEKVYNYLSNNGKTNFDKLSFELNIPSFKLSPILLNMEFSGWLQALPGKNFELLN